MHKNHGFPHKLIGVLLLWPWMILAAENDFAWQWPLVLSEPDAGAYQVTLDASVYQATYWPDWRDIHVLDADNQIVPAALYPANPTQSHTSSQFVDLPWFVLPSQATTSTDLSIVVKRDNNGSVININESSATPPPTHSNSPSWLIDSGTYSDQLRALSVEWANSEAVLDIGYRLETSDDLRQWQILVPEARLLQLHNGSEQLRNNRIAFNTARRYLRLVPLQAKVSVPALHRLRGEVMQKSTAEATWHWLELAAQAEHEPGGFEYRISGRFPIQRLDLIMPANSTATWQVFSLEEEETHDPRVRGWHLIMRSNNWNTWHINGKSADQPVQKSPPLHLGQTLNSQQWRLEPISPVTLPAAPILRLGWQAGHVIFLAQGRAPYSLVAGNAHSTAKPNHNVLEPMLAAFRQHHNGHWQPVMATLAEPVLRAGDSAYYVAPVKPDRQKVLLKLLLWGVLISGVLIVAQFATNLLRRLPKPVPSDHKDD